MFLCFYLPCTSYGWVFIAAFFFNIPGFFSSECGSHYWHYTMRSTAIKSSADIAMFFFMVGKPSKNFSFVLGLEHTSQQVGPGCFVEAI